MQRTHVVEKAPPRLARRTTKPGTTWRFFGVWLMMLMMAIAGTAAHAALPPAGTTIGNQAVATYTDSNGTNGNATSNQVITIIQQVPGLDLVDDRAKLGAPNGPVYFPHTVTNLGNGPDSFHLGAANDGGAFTVDQIFIYADANGDGIPDNFTAISVTPLLAAGASFSFVVAGHVPATATTGQIGKVMVIATSVFNNLLNDINNDTVTVTGNAIMDITKAIDNNVGTSNPQTTHTYTLNYANRGVGAASTVVITDAINSHLTYLTASGVTWNGTLVTGSTPGITVDSTTTPGTLVITIANVAPGQNGSISFQVQVNLKIPPQVIPNWATYTYDDGTGTIASQPTNTVNLTINAAAGVSGVDPAAQGPVPQGSTLYYDNVFTNTGTGTDTYDITIGTSTFPVGTTFKLYQPNDNTTPTGPGSPLLDSNSNSIPDTGPVLPGASYNVYVQVTLPAGVSNSAGIYTVLKTAKSTVDPTKTATVTDTLNGITPSTVDLKNPLGAVNGDGTPGTQGSLGTGQGPEATPVTTLSGDPGSTLTFNLSVTNSSANPDNYDLLASGTNAFSPTTVLPGGATVVFSSDAAGSSVITNTGNVGSLAVKNFYAQVKIPANATPFTASGIYFRATSPNSGALDTKFDAIIVNAVRAITVTPNHTGQTYAGSSIVYAHTVTNNSNTTETINLATSGQNPGFTSLIYLDNPTSGTPGVLDPSDTQITSLPTMAPGESRNIFVKVFAPANAVPGNVDVATVTGTTTANPSVLTAFATDTTTIVSSQLTMLKEQALDANLDSAPDGGTYKTDDITTGALPGTGIRYRITVTNNSALPITNVVVKDSTPPFTTYFEATPTVNDIGRAAFTKDGGVTYTAGSPIPASGGTGQLVFTIGALTPGQTAYVYFGVKINNTP